MQLVPEKFDKRSKARKLTEFETTDKNSKKWWPNMTVLRMRKKICHYTQTRVTEGAGKHKSGET